MILYLCFRLETTEETKQNKKRNKKLQNVTASIKSEKPTNTRIYIYIYMATERRVSNLNQSIKNFKWAASHSFRCDEFLVCLEKKQIQQQQQKKDQYNLYAVFILCLFVLFAITVVRAICA